LILTDFGVDSQRRGHNWSVDAAGCIGSEPSGSDRIGAQVICRDCCYETASFGASWCYGDIYTRSGLTKQQRSLVTISALVTQGTERQLELHINTGLTAGLTKTEIVEAFIHLIPDTGFPRVLNALYVAKEVFAQRDIDDPVLKSA
jgi:4-carboxymuconolactone decarboxylase